MYATSAQRDSAKRQHAKPDQRQVRDLTGQTNGYHAPEKENSRLECSGLESSERSTCVCCICCQPVSTSKNEVLFCTGTCQGWIHRYCVSVSVNAYQSIKDTGSPFLCFCYQQIRSQDEVTKLSNEVRQLKTKLPSSRLCSRHFGRKPRRILKRT